MHPVSNESVAKPLCGARKPLLSLRNERAIVSNSILLCVSRVYARTIEGYRMYRAPVRRGKACRIFMTGALCLPPIAFVPADRFPSWYERRLQTGQSKTWPEGIRGFLVSRRRLCRRRRVFRIPVDVGTSVCPRRSPTAEIFDPSSVGSYEPYTYTNLGDIGLCSNVRLYVSLAKMDTYICRRISICTWVYASVVRPSLQCQLRVFTMLAQACFQLN